MAELEIKEQQFRSVTVVDLTGKVKIGEGSVALRHLFRRLQEQNKMRLILNCAGLAPDDSIDSAGIGELITAWSVFNKAGGEIKLLRLSPKLQDLLAITRLLTLFELHNFKSTAINSFRKST